jgi:hypothetical protein
MDYFYYLRSGGPINDRNNFFVVLASEAAETTTRSINSALLASYERA